MNQGMLLESFNLAVVWNLPVIFVCKDNGWQITTQSEQVIGGSLSERARAFGLQPFDVDGLDAAAVWDVAGQAIQLARTGNGPSFIHATCVHISGHYLGDPLLRIASHPIREMAPLAGPLTRGFFGRSPAPLPARIKNLLRVSTAGWKLAGDEKSKLDDPLLRARANLTLDQPALQALESEVEQEIQQAVTTALAA
jgi:pyruvate dehydrogenase E1 component alpha subunit